MEYFETGRPKEALTLLKSVYAQGPDALAEIGVYAPVLKRRIDQCRFQAQGRSLERREASPGAKLKSQKKPIQTNPTGKSKKPVPKKPRQTPKKTSPRKKPSAIPTGKLSTAEIKPPEIQMTVRIEPAETLHQRFVEGSPATIQEYFLAQRAARLARADQFDNLICLGSLKGVRQYAYQVETVRKVMRSFRGRVLLADEVGLGKTIEAGMILKEYLMRGMVKKALILTPPALTSQWIEELQTKFQIQAVSTDHPRIRQEPDRFWRENDLIVASLALARNQRHRPLLTGIGFDMVIVDEAHHVKNDRTAGWKLINELKSRFLLLLSATPVENNLMDLFSLVTLLKPGQLGTKTAYRKQFVLRGDPTRPQNRARLRDLIGQVMVRNTRALADIKLPPRHATTVLVEGVPAEQELYAKLTDLVRTGFQRQMNKLSLGLLLQEAGSSPGAVRKTLLKLSRHDGVDSDLKKEMARLAKLCDYVPHTSKTTRLLELLKVSGEKVLVFSRFTATLEEIARRLSEEKVAYSLFHGGMGAADKDRAVESFQNGTPVMLCSEIGGEGRNLQFCATMVNFDLPWNPMKIEQRIGRIHRIGQTRPVHVYNLCADNTAEHHILEVLDRRINLFELVIGEVDLVLGQTRNEKEFEERILDIYGESRTHDDVVSAFDRLGDELLAARRQYDKIKQLDADLFSTDYEI
ncbi:SNF2 family N-terminal domain protein [delta proteobacterium NaphS2]|nr:SNF2 family N-terminal domain protein [delta proteobacterium NaphS2]